MSVKKKILFGGYLLALVGFSKPLLADTMVCNIENYNQYIWSEEKTNQLIAETGSGCDFSEADLSGANLSWANFSKANLTFADLSGADLSGVNLEEANLNGATLSWVNLTGANLKGANLSFVYAQSDSVGMQLGPAPYQRASF